MYKLELIFMGDRVETCPIQWTDLALAKLESEKILADMHISYKECLIDACVVEVRQVEKLSF